MRMVAYDRHGGIAGIRVVDAPAPAPTPGSVVVRIRATCINPGSLGALEGAPFAPVRDLAGEVVAVGDGVSGLVPGEAVLGWSDDAAHAELAAVPAVQLVAKPDALPWDVAGSLYVSGLAAVASVAAVAPAAGELVIVSGAFGGVGAIAAQLARHAGAMVIGLARADHADWLHAHGIVPVAYGDGQEQRLRAAAGSTPIAAFIDTVGGGYVDLALALGVLPTRINTIVDFHAAQAAGAKTLGTRQGGGATALLELAQLAASGVIEVPIAATYPLARVHDAFRAVAARDSHGKIVLHPQE